MFNFVESTKNQFKTPERFVAAVQNGETTQQQNDDLCNNAAYSLSGSRESLAKLTLSESEYYADELIRKLADLGMFAIIMERFTESMVVVCFYMDWDCESGDLLIKNAKERSSAGKSGKVDCKSEPCLQAITSCNHVDHKLYKHFNTILDDIINSNAIPDFPERVKKLDNVMEKSTAANYQKYPVNCRNDMELHNCEGNK